MLLQQRAQALRNKLCTKIDKATLWLQQHAWTLSAIPFHDQSITMCMQLQQQAGLDCNSCCLVLIMPGAVFHAGNGRPRMLQFAQLNT